MKGKNIMDSCLGKRKKYIYIITKQELQKVKCREEKETGLSDN